MWPRSGRSRPTRCLRKTDLPVPDGPSSTEISPLGSVSETFSQMTWRPKDLLSPSTLISTPTNACLPCLCNPVGDIVDRARRGLAGYNDELRHRGRISGEPRHSTREGSPPVVPLGHLPRLLKHSGVT